MKPNVISILVDSVSWDCTSTHRTKVSVTPFLDSLKKESLTASKLYSQGPYTDAATKSLYTGRNCLDDFAYFSKLNSSPTNHYKVFHQNGYETYGFYYPYYMVGSEIKKYIDHSYYTSKFAFGSEWGGIFYYYAEAIKSRKLTNNEYVLLQDHFSLLFDVWISFYQELLSNPPSSFLIKDEIGNFDINGALRVLESEKNKFTNSPNLYINDFLIQGKEHLLNTLDGIDVKALISQERLIRLFKDKEKLFKKISRNNFLCNVWCNRPHLRRIIHGIKRYRISKDRNELAFLKNYKRNLFSISSFKDASKKDLWQYLPSARREFDGGIDVLRQRNTNKPFYLSFHILDPHLFINFFSYDLLTRDDVVSEEFEMLSSFINDLGTNFKGNLPYLLSIRYSDYCLQRFCDSLKEMGLWDNTILLVFADHGSSFSYYPLHNTPVNCFDDECYHIPMWMRIPGMEGREITSYHNAIDIFPTLYEYLGFGCLEGVKGYSMLNSQNRSKNYVMTEYMGPGCPDLLSRRIWFSIRDNRYLVAYKVGIYERFEDGDLCEVYDLEKDPLAYYNINNKIKKESIMYLLSHINDRFNEVQSETKTYMINLKKKMLR